MIVARTFFAVGLAASSSLIGVGKVEADQQPPLEPHVAFGGVYGWEVLANSETWQEFRATKTGTLYVHFSASDPKRFGATNAAISAIIGRSTPIVVEISYGGGFNPSFFRLAYKTQILNDFTPRVAIINIDADGFTGKTDAQPFSSAFPTQRGSNDGANAADWPAFVAAGRAAGLKVLAPIVSPNACGSIGKKPPGCTATAASDQASPYVAHPWCEAATSGRSCKDDGWWSAVKQMAIEGGGVALDAPPGFYLRVLPDYIQRQAYQKFDVDVIKWAAANHVWSAYIASPLNNPDARSAGNKYLQDVQTNYRLLAAKSALPNMWIDENYEECGNRFEGKPCKASFEAPVGPESKANTQAAVGLWLARNAKVSQYTGDRGRLLNK